MNVEYKRCHPFVGLYSRFMCTQPAQSAGTADVLRRGFSAVSAPRDRDRAVREIVRAADSHRLRRHHAWDSNPSIEIEFAPWTERSHMVSWQSSAAPPLVRR